MEWQNRVGQFEKEDIFGVQQGELQGIFEAELLSLAKGI